MCRVAPCQLMTETRIEYLLSVSAPEPGPIRETVVERGLSSG